MSLVRCGLSTTYAQCSVGLPRAAGGCCYSCRKEARGRRRPPGRKPPSALVRWLSAPWLCLSQSSTSSAVSNQLALYAREAYLPRRTCHNTAPPAATTRPDAIAVVALNLGCFRRARAVTRRPRGAHSRSSLAASLAAREALSRWAGLAVQLAPRRRSSRRGGCGLAQDGPWTCTCRGGHAV